MSFQKNSRHSLVDKFNYTPHKHVGQKTVLLRFKSLHDDELTKSEWKSVCNFQIHIIIHETELILGTKACTLIAKSRTFDEV